MATSAGSRTSAFGGSYGFTFSGRVLNVHSERRAKRVRSSVQFAGVPNWGSTSALSVALPVRQLHGPGRAFVAIANDRYGRRRDDRFLRHDVVSGPELPSSVDECASNRYPPDRRRITGYAEAISGDDWLRAVVAGAASIRDAGQTQSRSRCHKARRIVVK